MSNYTGTDEPIERVILLLDEIEMTLAEVRAIAREMKAGEPYDFPGYDDGYTPDAARFAS